MDIYAKALNAQKMFGGSKFILVLYIVFIDLVYGIPKIERRNERASKSRRLWARQGLAQSVEVENASADKAFKDRRELAYGKEDPDDEVEYKQQDDNDNDQGDYNNQKPEKNNGEYYDYSTEYDINPNDPPMAKLSAKIRAMQVGDTFVAQEMLPIAIKLMQKIKNGRGEGKGIISSATHPKILADTLYERFFMSMKRIVILKDFDIDGLDALQALALSGEVAERSSGNSITESPENGRGEYNGRASDIPIRKCHYKLLRKSINGDKITYSKKRNGLRRRVDLSKKLAKKRKLVVNPARRGPAMKNHNHKPQTQGKIRIPNSKKANVRKNNQGYRGNERRTQKHKTDGSRKVPLKQKEDGPKADGDCRWRYECMNRTDLGSCRLQADCSPEVRNAKDYIGLKLKDEEFTEAFKDFRRMVGVNVIDEEVEKILEKRYMILRPIAANADNKRVETLANYFNNLLIREQLDGLQTSPKPLAGKVQGDENINEYDTASLNPLVTAHAYDELDVTTIPSQYPGGEGDEIKSENEEAVPAPEDSGTVEDGIKYENEEMMPVPVVLDTARGDINPENEEVIPTPEDSAVAGDEIKYENEEAGPALEEAGAASDDIKPESEEVIPAPEESGAADEEIKYENEEVVSAPELSSAAGDEINPENEDVPAPEEDETKVLEATIRRKRRQRI